MLNAVKSSSVTVEGGFTAEHMAEGHRQPCARCISTTTRCALRALFLSKFLSLPFVKPQRVLDLKARWFLASCAETSWNPDHERTFSQDLACFDNWKF